VLAVAAFAIAYQMGWPDFCASPMWAAYAQGVRDRVAGCCTSVFLVGGLAVAARTFADADAYPASEHTTLLHLAIVVFVAWTGKLWPMAKSE